MRSCRYILAAVFSCALILSAVAQGADQQSVDDFIARVIRQGATGDAAKAALPVVMGVRIGEHADRTRFIVEFSDPISVRTFSLSNPNRVVIDMPAVQWRLANSPRPSGSGPVKSYRYGLFRPGNSRFVIDLNRPVAISEPVAWPPEGGLGYRIVIDLTPSTQAAFEQGAGWPADLKARETQAERTAAKPRVPNLQRKVVVIDPGHGGIDPGTNGINGMIEKDLVLDEGVRLAHALLRAGPYTVHLTRDSDVYIPLRERRDIARSWHADLFVSLHAD